MIDEVQLTNDLQHKALLEKPAFAKEIEFIAALFSDEILEARLQYAQAVFCLMLCPNRREAAHLISDHRQCSVAQSDNLLRQSLKTLPDMGKDFNSFLESKGVVYRDGQYQALRANGQIQRKSQKAAIENSCVSDIHENSAVNKTAIIKRNPVTTRPAPAPALARAFESSTPSNRPSVLMDRPVVIAKMDDESDILSKRLSTLMRADEISTTEASVYRYLNNTRNPGATPRQAADALELKTTIVMMMNIKVKKIITDMWPETRGMKNE